MRSRGLGDRAPAGPCTIGVIVSRIPVILLPLACLAYGALALGMRRAWLSAAAATLLAWLLWRRHPRARFAAYIFFSALALRGVTREGWPMLAFAVAGVLVMQTPTALAAWPRLTPGFKRHPDDRIRKS